MITNEGIEARLAAGSSGTVRGWLADPDVWDVTVQLEVWERSGRSPSQCWTSSRTPGRCWTACATTIKRTATYDAFRSGHVRISPLQCADHLADNEVQPLMVGAVGVVVNEC
jgi:hypothetical protein